MFAKWSALIYQRFYCSGLLILAALLRRLFLWKRLYFLIILKLENHYKSTLISLNTMQRNVEHLKAEPQCDIYYCRIIACKICYNCKNIGCILLQHLTIILYIQFRVLGENLELEMKIFNTINPFN